jgi:hypothetical protein
MTNSTGLWFIGDGLTEIQKMDIAAPKAGSSIEGETHQAIGTTAVIGIGFNKKRRDHMCLGGQPNIG